MSRPPPIVVVVIVIARCLSLPSPQISVVRMPRRQLKGIHPPSIAVLRHCCPRRTSRWASLILIVVLVVVVIVDVGATPMPSDGVHGICHGTTAGRGASNDANFGHSGSLWMPPLSL